jgi:hypothetical protein
MNQWQYNLWRYWDLNPVSNVIMCCIINAWMLPCYVDTLNCSFFTDVGHMGEAGCCMVLCHWWILSDHTQQHNRTACLTCSFCPCSPHRSAALTPTASTQYLAVSFCTWFERRRMRYPRLHYAAKLVLVCMCVCVRVCVCCVCVCMWVCVGVCLFVCVW